MKTATGSKIFLISQDRDKIYTSTGKLFSTVHEVDGVYFGINLFQSRKGKVDFLGTFSNVMEVVTEINNIRNTDLEIYAVSGYYNGKWSGEDEKILTAWANI